MKEDRELLCDFLENILGIISDSIMDMVQTCDVSCSCCSYNRDLGMNIVERIDGWISESEEKEKN